MSEPCKTCLNIAHSKNTGIGVLNHLILSPSPEVREAAAGAYHASPAVLTKLARDKVEQIRRAVAKNPKTPPELLTELARDPSRYVREEVADNPATPKAVLAELGTSLDWQIRLVVAANKNTGMPTQRYLCNDAHMQVQRVARETFPWHTGLSSR